MGVRKYPKVSPIIRAKAAWINIFPIVFLLITANKTAIIETLIATIAVTIMSKVSPFLLPKYLSVDSFVNYLLTVH